MDGGQTVAKVQRKCQVILEVVGIPVGVGKPVEEEATVEEEVTVEVMAAEEAVICNHPLQILLKARRI